MEKFESHGILEFHLPGLDSHRKSWKMVFIVQNKLGWLFFVKKRVKTYPKTR